MEVITFESKAYTDLAEKIDRIARYVVKKETIPPPPADIQEAMDSGWLDSDEVSEMLGISTRTLQRLRARNHINYSLLGGKCYYKASDIETALKDRLIRCRPETIEDFRKNYLLYVKQK